MERVHIQIISFMCRIVVFKTTVSSMIIVT